MRALSWKALLWKEWRAVRWAVALGAVGVFVGQWVHSQQSFNAYNMLFDPIVLVWLLSLVLGGDALANERGRGTLDFVLTQPLEVWRLLAVKVGVRGGSVVGLVGVYWLAVSLYPDHIGGIGERQVFEQLGFVRHWLIWSLPFVFLFCVGLLLSALSASSLKAASGALPVGALCCALAAALVYYLHPTWDAEHILPFVNHDGFLWRAALDPGALVGRVLLWAALCALAVAATAALLKRRIAWNLPAGWLALAGLLAVGAYFSAGILYRKNAAPTVPPITELTLQDGKIWDLAVQGERAYVLKGEAEGFVLQVIDITRPAAPRPLQRFALPAISGTQRYLAVEGSRAYVTAFLPRSSFITV